MNDSINRVLVRWFVQYNPLFTASALCVLGGVFVISRLLEGSEQLLLTAVLELYSWLVIGVAALLYRRLHEERAGVILGLIALVLLVDPTLQASTLAANGEHLASALWLASFALKWRALVAAFRLRLSVSLRLLPIVVAAVAAGLPSVILVDGGARGWLGIVFAVLAFAIGAVLQAARAEVQSERALGDIGITMFPRLLRGAVVIAALGVGYQALNVALSIDGSDVLALAGGAIASVALTGSEKRGWWCAIGGLVLCFLGNAPVAAFGIACVALLAASVGKAPRLLTASIMAGLAAALLLSSHGRFPELGGLTSSHTVMLAVGIATLALVVVAVVRRAQSAGVALALLHAHWLERLPALSHAELGVTLLAAGFVLLPLGVVLLRVLRRAHDKYEADALGHEPSTSVAAGTRAAV